MPETALVKRARTISAHTIREEIPRRVKIDERAAMPARPSTPGSNTRPAVRAGDLENGIAWPTLPAPEIRTMRFADHDRSHHAGQEGDLSPAMNKDQSP